MTKPVGWTLTKPPPLTELPPTNERQSTSSPLSTHAPEIQARLLLALSQNHPPSVYVPHLKSFKNPSNEWPNLIAACLIPEPCSQLQESKNLLKALPAPDQTTEMLPEPVRAMSYKPPAPGYCPKIVTPEVRQRSGGAHVPSAHVGRKPSVGEVIRLGTGMQPTLSRRRSALTTKTSLPRVRSLFLSGRKSEKARAAEEKEREEREKVEKEEEREKEREKEKEKEREEQQAERAHRTDANGNNFDMGNGEEPVRRNELLDLDHDSDLDYTVQDAAEIERTEGMDEDMIRTQRDKEARPRHVGEIVKKMHSTTPGARNVVAAEIDLPRPTDTAYARGLRREEAAKKRQELAETTREKERILAEQRREKFNRKRKRKLRKVGRTAQEESEEDETSPAPPEEASRTTEVDDRTHPGSPGGSTAQRRRTDPPSGRYDPPPNDRYGGQPYDDRRMYDNPQGYPPPPHDTGRYNDRPPNWPPPQHPYHPSPPPHYAPPSPYYGSPSPYYYPPSPYYRHLHPQPGPPQQYYPPPRAPPRLSREQFEKRRRELYDHIGRMCGELHADDAWAIDEFLDNQEHMFRGNEKTKYFLLEQASKEEVLLRIDRESHGWEVVRKQMSN